MGKSWRIATISGIPVLLHWTLGLFVMFFVWFAYRGSFDIAKAGYLLGFITCLFICILLHEFGHSLTAKRFGVKTKDIILSPIGGLARLESIPENPIQELKITINGPMVNLVIAGLLAGSIALLGMDFSPGFSNGGIEIDGQNFLQWLMYMNIGVFMFNLIPAFPMDGGRILRSLLSTRIGRKRATFWASMIGKLFSILFVLFAVFNGYLMLAIIGPFIYFLAGQEYQQVKLSETMKETSLDVILKKDFIKILETDLISDFISRLEFTEERDFLVYDVDGNICGSLPSIFVEEIQNSPSEYNLVKDIASPKHNSLNIDQSIEEAFRLMKDEGLAIIAIKKDGQTIGMVDRPIISKFILGNSRTKFLS